MNNEQAALEAQETKSTKCEDFDSFITGSDEFELTNEMVDEHIFDFMI